MDSLLKISAGILLCLPLTGCAGPGYYDPSTGMVCSGDLYGPTNMIDDIRCSLSKHRAHRMQKQSCNSCCDPCGNFCSNSGGTSIPALLTSGTFNSNWTEESADTYAPHTHAPQSSCPHCQSQAGTMQPESNMYESYTPETYAPETYAPDSAPSAPATVVPKKITPVPDHGPKGALGTPAPAPAAEAPMPKTSYVPPALLTPPAVGPSSAAPTQQTRRVQWVPAQIH